MTNSEITTQVRPSTTIAQFLVPGVAAAQRAGDADYAAVLATTHDGELAARAYHVAYQALARVPGGCGPVCDCELCQGEFGARAGAS